MHLLAFTIGLASVASCYAAAEQTTKSSISVTASHSTVAASSATASATPLPSPPKAGAKFVLRTSILPGQKNAARFNNLYVSQLVDEPQSWFELFENSPQVFVTTESTIKASNASVDYRNILYKGALSYGKHRFFWNNRQLLFDYAGWQFAGGSQYNNSVPGESALTNGTFYFDEATGLRWNNTINERQDFKHWLACPWWYDTIQLFWFSGTDGAGPYTIPSFCAKVNLLPYAAPATGS